MTSRSHASAFRLACLLLAPLVLRGAANIVIVNADPAGVGFNDTTAATPVGGNAGTTLGQQRLNVFKAAADKWGATLSSSITIRIHAVWTALMCTSNSAVLGSAGATQAWKDFANAPVAHHWYGKAQANALSGTDQDNTAADIEANFNVNLGNPGCLTGVHFYLGLDNNYGSNVDLVTVLIHEFAHGLGFQTFTNGQTGAQLGGTPSIWDDFLLDTTTNKTWTLMTNAERAASALNSGHLAWNGGNVSAAIPQVLQPQGSSFMGADPTGRGLLFNPSPYQSGSSISHWSSAMFRNQLMEPVLASNLTHEVSPPQDLTLPLLRDIGWIAGAAAPAPNLTITKKHTGDFTQGQTGATYTMTVSNNGPGNTIGTVTVTDTMPAGLTATAISGTGWSCTPPSGPCTRGDALAAGTSYPPITLSVNVAPNAPASITNTATVSGGGSSNSTASDLTNSIAVGAVGSAFSQLGVFRPPSPAGLALGFFTLDSNGTNAFEVIDKTRQFGLAGDTPIVGDWTGSGVVRLGVVRCPAVGAGLCNWYLDINNNGRWDGTFGGDAVFPFGLPGDIPVAGDWNGTGVTKAGVMRCPVIGVCTWYLDVGNKRLPSDPTNLILQYGLIGDKPAVGNWSGIVAGNSPVDQVGVFRCPATGTCLWIVDSNGDGKWQPSDNVFAYGLAGDIPVVGNWNGNSQKRIGVFRNGLWITDTNGNGTFDVTDQVFNFGLPGDKPVVGLWTVQ